MAIVTTVKAPEQFIVDVNGNYNVCFESINVTAAVALPSGTVLKDAATAAVAADTVAIGILADDKPAGAKMVRVMVRGNPSRVDKSQLTGADAAAITALAAVGIIVK